MVDALRDFFLDESAPWPDDLCLSCWPYLGGDQVIVRGFGIMGVLDPRYGVLVGELMKFRPVAFWLTDGEPARSGYHFGLVAPLGSGQGQTALDIELPLRGFPPRSGQSSLVITKLSWAGTANFVCRVGSVGDLEALPHEVLTTFEKRTSIGVEHHPFGPIASISAPRRTNRALEVVLAGLLHLAAVDADVVEGE